MSNEMTPEDVADLLAALYVRKFCPNDSRRGRFHMGREELKLIWNAERMTLGRQFDYADGLAEYDLCAVIPRTPDEDRHGVVSINVVEAWSSVDDSHIAEAIKAIPADPDEELTGIWLSAHRLQLLMEHNPEYHDGAKLSVIQIALLADMTSADIRFDDFPEIADTFGYHEFELPVRMLMPDPTERWFGILTNQSLSRWRHFTLEHKPVLDEIMAEWSVADNEANVWPEPLGLTQAAVS